MNELQSKQSEKRKRARGAIHIRSGNGFDVRNKKTGQGHCEYLPNSAKTTIPADLFWSSFQLLILNNAAEKKSS